MASARLARISRQGAPPVPGSRSMRASIAPGSSPSAASACSSAPKRSIDAATGDGVQRPAEAGAHQTG